MKNNNWIPVSIDKCIQWQTKHPNNSALREKDGIQEEIQFDDAFGEFEVRNAGVEGIYWGVNLTPGNIDYQYFIPVAKVEPKLTATIKRRFVVEAQLTDEDKKIIDSAYGWEMTEDGEFFCLIEGDMGYVPLSFRCPYVLDQDISSSRIMHVKIERLTHICADDALGEGVAETPFWKPKELNGRPFEEKWWDDFHFWTHYPQLVFKEWWKSKHGEDSWNDDVFVWVVTFQVVLDEIVKC